MRYLVIGKGVQPDGPPPAGLLDAIMKLGADATKAGALLDTGGLAPGTAARLQVSDGRLDVTDGPFTEAKEWISYAIYQVRTKEEAVEWTSRFLQIHRDLWPGWEGEVEVLQMFGPGDHAPSA
ncbi:YciI family protein [Pseudonocardia lacus]|uniref:YciI family protein n=1 Tax=Pseudonocardia lacus TaxID=2835865 RepID=UPI001BDBBDF3|nr:YciI family protein [Pseudonocardia lacus]